MWGWREENRMACDVASDQIVEFIIPNNGISLEELSNAGYIACSDAADARYRIIYVPSRFEGLVRTYDYVIAPKLYTPLDASAMAASGITETLGHSYLQLKGQGTIIGFIDTGIDYQNPLFKNEDGTTRIIGLWDQTASTAEREDWLSHETPYGVQYTREDIDSALSTAYPLAVVPSMDEIGHGTFMAGIAAGNEAPSLGLTGAAPACAIAVVKLKPAKQYLREFYRIQDSAIAYQENDIMMGIRYLEQLSLAKRMPLVIYIGLGTNYGSHEGTSPLCLMLERVNRLVGVVAVLPAGNEAGLGHHYQGYISRDQEFEDVEIRVGQNERGFVAELWASKPEMYSVGFLSPLGQVVQRIPTSRSLSTVTFTLEATSIQVAYGVTEHGSGSEVIFMRFENPTPGIWSIRVFNTLFMTGSYHIWLPVQGFISEDTFFLQPNPFTTITEPGNTDEPITVSTYNHHDGGLYIHSSRGYSRENTVKPDIAAPGVAVRGPGLPGAGTPNEYSIFPRTGSSVAAAIVAGAAANLLTWGIVLGNDITMTAATVKTQLIRGATRATSLSYPNREWGFGKLNLYNSMLHLRE